MATAVNACLGIAFCGFSPGQGPQNDDRVEAARELERRFLSLFHFGDAASSGKFLSALEGLKRKIVAPGRFVSRLLATLSTKIAPPTSLHFLPVVIN